MIEPYGEGVRGLCLCVHRSAFLPPRCVRACNWSSLYYTAPSVIDRSLSRAKNSWFFVLFLFFLMENQLLINRTGNSHAHFRNKTKVMNWRYFIWSVLFNSKFDPFHFCTIQQIIFSKFKSVGKCELDSATSLSE